jgi:hypothetical protein
MDQPQKKAPQAGPCHVRVYYNEAIQGSHKDEDPLSAIQKKQMTIVKTFL